MVCFVVGFFSLVAINLIWLLPSLRETKENAMALKLEVAKRGAKEIEALVGERIDSLEKFSRLFSRGQTLAEIKLLMDFFVQSNQEFIELVYWDKNGKENVKSFLDGVYFEDSLGGRKDNNFLKQALEGETFLSEVFFSGKTEPFVILAVPVFSPQKEISGALSARLKLTQVQQIIDNLNIETNSHIFVIDGKGQLIAGQNPSLIIKNFALVDQKMARQIMEKQAGAGNSAQVNKYFKEGTQDVLAAGVLLEKLPWGLIIESPEADAYAGVFNKIITFILISFIGGIGIILVTQWLTRYLISPLRKLSEGAGIIGSGNLDYRLDISTGDEIEDLADSFNQLAAQTKESHFFLEKKVAERTKELKAQRDQLDETTKNLVRRDAMLTEMRQKQEKALKDTQEARAKAEEARLATLNVLEDINEARRAQAAEKKKVEAVLLSLTDGLIALDKAGKISLINSRAEALLNIKRDDVILKPLNEIENQAIKKVGLLLEKNKEKHDSSAVIFEQDRQMLEIVFAPVIDASGGICGQLLIFHDVTREKAIEKMKSEFVSIAAHQLRTPLSAIKWTLRLVLDQDFGSISSQQAEILQKGYQSNERMINLVNDLLNVARIEEGRFIYKFTRISFVSLIKETIDALQSLIKIKNVAVKFNGSKGATLEIMGDQEKIKLAIQNLIENALNYSPAGSCVTISLKYDKIGLVFGVTDKGMGVPKDQQSRLFTKFFRGNNAVKMETEGTGLGLFIVKNIIEGHGGKVWFKSEEGKGSVFYFSLPVKR